MHIVALVVVISTAFASLGIAAWAWHATASMADELRDLAGFKGIHFEED
jgi:hypothetical protein